DGFGERDGLGALDEIAAGESAGAAALFLDAIELAALARHGEVRELGIHRRPRGLEAVRAGERRAIGRGAGKRQRRDQRRNCARTEEVQVRRSIRVRRNSRLKRSWQPSERDSRCVDWILRSCTSDTEMMEAERRARSTPER